MSIQLKIIQPISRILISTIFLMSAFGKITNFAGTQQYMAIYGMPLTAFFLICAIILEVVGGLSILLGYKARLAGVILVIFLVPTTLIFHAKFSDQIQMIMFLKNLAIIGALLMVVSFGPGHFSIDEKQTKE